MGGILKDGNFVFGLGFFRFLFAVAVLLGHSQEIPGFRFVGGEVAVECFYIISGFYMFMILRNKYHRITTFYLNRFLRLYPIYIATVFLTLFTYFVFDLGSADLFSRYWTKFDWIAKSYFVTTNFSMLFIDFSNFLRVNASNGSIYFTTLDSHSNPIAYSFVFIPQAWTLGLEIYFYLLAPSFVKLKTKYLLGLAVLSLAVRLCLWLFMLRHDPWTYRFFPSELFFFIAGGCCYRFYSAFIISKKRDFQTIAIFASIGTLFLSSVPLYFDLSKLTFECLYFPLFVLAMPFIFHCSRNNTLDRKIGELSYPTYIVHTLIIAIVSNSPLGEPLKSNNLTGVIVIVLSVLLSLLLIQYIQNPVEIVRRQIAGGSLQELVKRATWSHGVASLRQYRETLCSCLQFKHLLLAFFVISAFLLLLVLPEKLYPPLYFDLFDPALNKHFKTIGFGAAERDGKTQTPFIWGYGPCGAVCFDLPLEKKMKLNVRCYTPTNAQNITVKLNGAVIGEKTPVPSGWMTQETHFEVFFTSNPGLNILEIVYSEWNGLRTVFAENDTRALAVAFAQLQIESAFR